MTRRHGLVVVVAGPSGVGKGAVHERVRATLDDSLLSVSVTTRAPRPGERDGVDYHFVDDETFEWMVAGGELLEHATYAGNRYGTPAGPVLAAVEAGRVVILDIEVQGALQVRERVPGALLVFLVPPSLRELEARLRGRGTENDDQVADRLRVAQGELEQRERFDVVVVNDDLERCAAEVVEAIERARVR